MKEAMRKEIIRLWDEGASRRQIARRLRIPRHSVVRMAVTAIVDRERRRPSYAFDVMEVRVDCPADGFSMARPVYVFEYVLIHSRLMYVRCLAARDLVAALRQAATPGAFRYDNMKLAGTSAAADPISFERSFQDEHCHGDFAHPD